MKKESPPLTRWERHKERTRRRLLEAAETLFRSQGFDAVTVEEIANAADVAKGTFFNYFESKDLLLAELLYHRVSSILLAPPGAGQPALDRIRMTLLSVWEEMEPYRHLARRMFNNPMLRPQPAGPTLVQTLAELICEGQDAGIFRADADPEVAATMLTSYFFRISIIECLKGNYEPPCEGQTDDLDWSDRLERGIDLLLRGLAAQPERS